MNKLTINPETIQEIREWRRKQVERYGESGHAPTSWLTDYLNNFHTYIEGALKPETTYQFKTRTMDVKLSDEIDSLSETGKRGWTERISELRKDKTTREFYADIRDAVNYFGFDPVMDGLVGRLRGTPTERRKSLAHRMKVFLKLREMGYSRLDLIG